MLSEQVLILAAMMSTADSQRLVSSSALAEDFYKQHIRTEASSSEVMMVGRIGVIVLSLLALFLAMSPDSSGIIFATASIVIASLTTATPEQSVLDQFQEFEKNVVEFD